MNAWPESTHRPLRALSRRAIAVLLGPFLILQGATAHAAGTANGLNILRRDLCHSFKLDCRKQQAAPPAKRPAAKPKSPPQSTKLQKPVTAVPTPVLKPQAPAQTVAAPAPVPRAKPATTPPARVAEPPSPPIPRERPSLPRHPPTVAGTTVTAPATPARDPEPEKPRATMASIPPQAATSTGPSTCVQSLRTAKVRFEVVPASFGEAACPVADPVRLLGVDTPSGTVTFPEGPVFSCRFAQTFAQWVSDTGAAVVLAQTRKRLEKMATGPGYECRRRNGDSSAKMSEHAAGDAVDITSMTIAEGTTIRMADAINPASPSYPVLRALRTTACGYFTTVLGPGANEAHKEHYHFDLGLHGKSANYRICE